MTDVLTLVCHQTHQTDRTDRPPAKNSCQINKSKILVCRPAFALAPTVKGPGYGQTQPGHDVDGGFRPVLNAGPDLSEVTQPGLGQGGRVVTSWDDMRKK